VLQNGFSTGAESAALESEVAAPTMRPASAADWICLASRRRILIVDDNDRHLDILGAVLCGVGHEVETCGSGAEALRRLAARLYDVVVLDLVMPEISGLAVALEMRSGGANTHTPIVICTANAILARRDLADVAGIDAIIGKPIDTAALVLAVEHAPGAEHHSSQLRI